MVGKVDSCFGNYFFSGSNSRGAAWCSIIWWNTLPTSSLPSKWVPLKNGTTSSDLCFLVIRFFSLNASSHINTTILTLVVGRKWHRITVETHKQYLTKNLICSNHQLVLLPFFFKQTPWFLSISSKFCPWSLTTPLFFSKQQVNCGELVTKNLSLIEKKKR